MLDLLAPRQRILLWVFGPESLRKIALWFADHPAAMRLRGIARIGTGVWLASRQYREAPQPSSSSWHQRWSSRYRLAEHRSAGLVAAISLIAVLLYRRRSRSK